ncbi:hypothetical protein THRCLA_09350 [Thraustotheca clavata]|uniref:MYND-type domain-containing protein n=1 Tax=Thraustotheca clavata TaxID=74557 RepID=A0A1V9YXG1_9STRA|nr:hypothetical protein THRCLA_09350 [Thraustotheca clavata]
MAHLENEFLSKRYQKWDNFKDDDEDDVAVPLTSQTQYDLAGDEDITIVDQVLLSRDEVEKLKKFDQTKQEIWQIVVRKLRVWSASSKGAEEGEDAIPCRPYAILVNNIYPLGQVVSKKICDPPEEFPSAAEILKLSLDSMNDPPSNIPQHRPDKIVFADKNLVGQLRCSYAAIGIECTFLTESDGINECISELSGHLVRKDLASIGSVSEKPGLISLGLPADSVAQWYDACATFVELSPWHKMVERQSIQVDASSSISLSSKPNSSVQGGSVYVSVLGHSNDPNEETLKGMALFFTRTDLQRRVLPPGQTLALMENPELRRCASCDKKAKPGSDLKRCTRCQCVFYCDATCQRNHWKVHKINCVDPKKAKPDSKQHMWGARELSIFFGGITSMPFDDLDAIDKYNCRVGKWNGQEMYPTPMLFLQGEPSAPLPSDLIWLTRGLNSINRMLMTNPSFLNTSMAGLLGMNAKGEPVDTTEEAKLTFEIPTLLKEDTEQVVIRNSSVLSMQDVEALRSAIKKKNEEMAANPDTSETSNDATNDGSCEIM